MRESPRVEQLTGTGQRNAGRFLLDLPVVPKPALDIDSPSGRFQRAERPAFRDLAVADFGFGS
jgi:hypothetical protein